MKMYALAMFQLVRSSQQCKLRINSACCAKLSGLRQGHAASYGGVINSCKVYRRALTGKCMRHSLSAGLHTANAKPLTAGQQFNLVASLYGAGDQRAGYHCSKAFHGEGAIDRQTKRSRGVFAADLRRSVVKGTF